MAEPECSSPTSLAEEPLLAAQAIPWGGRKREMKLILNKLSQSLRIGKVDIGPNGTVYMKGCDHCDVVIEAVCCKVMVESCKHMKLAILDRILTQTLDVWECDNIEVKICTPVKTVQVDLSKNIKFHFEKAAHFQSLIWSQADDLQLRLLDKEEEHPPLNAGCDIVSKDGTFPALKREIDQFIVQVVKGVLINEQVVRLENGFPSTIREAKEHEDRLEAKLRSWPSE